LCGSGDVTVAAEFNVYCDASAAQFVLSCPVTKTLLPLDIASQACLTFDFLTTVNECSTSTGRLLQAILPGAFKAFRQRRGIEGILAPEAVAVAVAIDPTLMVTESYPREVETGGSLTHGATIIDRRVRPGSLPNADVVVEIDVDRTVECILDTLTS
ncbi:MAG: nucleoside hydrolase, partial [Planctomycetales bacterium]|nr:nucleoside hydrolase [Planctomycetales bacterium]